MDVPAGGFGVTGGSGTWNGGCVGTGCWRGADGRGMFVRSERRPVISDVASYSLATEKSTVKIKIKFT